MLTLFNLSGELMLIAAVLIFILQFAACILSIVQLCAVTLIAQWIFLLLSVTQSHRTYGKERVVITLNKLSWPSPHMSSSFSSSFFLFFLLLIICWLSKLNWCSQDNGKQIRMKQSSSSLMQTNGQHCSGFSLSLEKTDVIEVSAGPCRDL